MIDYLRLIIFSGLRRIVLKSLSSAGLLLIATVPSAVAEDLDSRGVDFFETRIRPVLVEQCQECHAADAKQVRGGLLVDSREGLLSGGDSGPAIVPGKPEESPLIEALRFESFEMPPEGQLPRETIEDFVKWIEMGAPDPRTGTAPVRSSEIDLEAGRQHWSFRPVSMPEVPTLKDNEWPLADIDRFVLAQIESAGLSPGKDADKLTLLRRVTFDLTGLPPTLEEQDAFLADDRTDALDRVVDRLLDSPAFGERWGRHWLDVARFSESTGGGRSLLFGDAWRYRDYVIESFNTDTPYDRFVIEQVAGDLLPYDSPQAGERQLTATAFLMLGPHNYENQDKEQLRMDVIDEQIDVLGRAFLGMTLGCGRCHDHKFDPIPTKDYYALAGIFRSTNMLVDGNVSGWTKRPVPLSAKEQQQLAQHEARLSELTTRFKKRNAELDGIEKRLPVVLIDDDDAKLKGDWTESTSVEGFSGDGYRHASGGMAEAVYRLDIEVPSRFEVGISYTPHANRSPNALVKIDHTKGTSSHRIDQRKSEQLDGMWHSLGEFSFEESVVVTISTEGTQGAVIADGVQLRKLDSENSAELEELQARKKILTQEIKKLQQTLTEHKQSTPEPETVMAVEEAPEPEDYFVCIRGNHQNLGEAVPRGALSVMPDGGQLEIPPQASGRLELARWIASSENPLTARVMVNRIWHHLFGVGIVRTVDNFGIPGEAPSHPVLLDYLASRFMDSGWSVKDLIRELVLSRTYQLSSASSRSSASADPENRLLSHQNRRRLDAEALYDSILMLSGTLDLSAGGDTVREGTRSEYGYAFEDRLRAVYLPVFRNRLHDLMTVFDFPDPNLSTGRRNLSTLSTQALFLLNSPFIIQQARTAADQLLEDDRDVNQRIDRLFLQALSRLPTPDERNMAKNFVQDGDDPEAWAGFVQMIVASIDFRYLN